ncbi:hypothetical protein NP493_66g06018 [Ridgeia piscesae]|uniref:Reverse transcriptase domain-containing protein n=1 Tax=Ridgeia piscesae TaxID=27915 RepID=A0AAD9UIK1_RIDPI|nr:hypothetical protein NP493_66g06018 [Ridgeia piscesae]
MAATEEVWMPHLEKFPTMIEALHTGMMANVSVGGEFSESFSVTNEVKQGNSYNRYAIAFDFVSRLWYNGVYVDRSYCIMASTLDNRHRFVVIITRDYMAKDIALDPVRGCIIEGVKRKHLRAVMTFIDFKKAFDSIHRGKLMKILRAYGIPACIVQSINDLYDNTSAKVLTPDGKSRRVRPEIQTDFDIADDIALVSDSVEKAQALLLSVEGECQKMGLQLNAKKTEVMTFNINEKPKITTKHGTILAVKEDFKYLGFYISSTEKDIWCKKLGSMAATQVCSGWCSTLHGRVGSGMRSSMEVSLESLKKSGREDFEWQDTVSDTLNWLQETSFYGNRRRDELHEAASL